MKSTSSVFPRAGWRPRFLAGPLALLLAALAGVTSAVAAAPPAASQPNIVFIMCDDLGWGDVGFHGSNIATPNVDKLAREGLELTQYYVAPVCTPSRAALMTGRYWSRFGISGVQAIRSLPVDTVTLPRALKSVGYDTAMMGKWHLGSKLEWGPNHYGFDYSYGSLGGGVGPYNHFYKTGPYMQTWHRNNEFVTEPGHVTDLIGNDVVKWIDGRKDNPTPFFLYVPFTAPHIPIKEPAEWLDKVPADFTITTDMGGPSATPLRFTGLLARHYAACVMHMDYEVGRIVAALEKSGKRENTLIVFTSDNGAFPTYENCDLSYPADDYPKGPIPGSNFPLRGTKGELYDGGIHVACVINCPARLEPGKSDEPLGVIDWMPTFCAVAGYTPDRGLKWDGVNAWPVLRHETTLAGRRLLYCNVVPGNELRDGDWKLIVHKGKGGKNLKTELFELPKDPREITDRAPQMPEKVQAMRQKLIEQSKNDNDAVVPDRARMLKEWPNPPS